MGVDPVVLRARVEGTFRALDALNLGSPYSRGWIDALAWVTTAMDTPAGDELDPVPAAILDGRA